MPNRLWAYAAGERGLNRVRVYERRPDGPLYIEFYDSLGRHQKSLTTASGIPVFSHDLAMKIADQAARAQRIKREGQVAHKLLGLPQPRTLGELAKHYHDAKSHEWSAHYKLEQDLNKRFWFNWLGKDKTLTEITPALAMGAMRRALEAHGSGNGKLAHTLSPRSQQKRIKYLKELFNFAQKKLKWITEVDNLSALDAPRPDSVSRPYSEEEVMKLLSATLKIDLRLAVVAHLTWVSGRRLEALRTLPSKNYRVQGEYGVIQMPGKTDKARRTGEIFVTGKTKGLVEELLSKPAVRANGWFFPTGNLEDPARGREPISNVALRDQLHRAEEAAGIPYVAGRAFHGIKRRFATVALRFDPQAASKQSGTRRDTLEDAYEQDDPAGKQALARELDRMIGVR